jgi:hypothetical protein
MQAKARKKPRKARGVHSAVAVLYLLPVTTHHPDQHTDTPILEVPNGWIVEWGNRDAGETP